MGSHRSVIRRTGRRRIRIQQQIRHLSNHQRQPQELGIQGLTRTAISTRSKKPRTCTFTMDHVLQRPMHDAQREETAQQRVPTKATHMHESMEEMQERLLPRTPLG